MRWWVLILGLGAIGCESKFGRILLFDGFGTRDGARVSGRVIEDPRQKADPERGKAGNLVDNIAIMETDEIPGVLVELKTERRTVRVRTDADGVFTATVAGPFLEIEQLITARAVESKGFSIPETAGMLHVFEEGVLVISDFDDTIVKSEVTSKARLAANTMLRNAAQIPVVEGVAHAFEDARIAGVCGFIYLTGSPHNLHERVRDVLLHNKIPRGPLLMKNFGSDPLFEQQEYKTRHVRELMKIFPKNKFILVGDTGERDPEIYRGIAKEFPDRVAGIVIRKTAGSDMTPARFEGCKLVDDYRGDPSPIAALIATSTETEALPW